ncbi:MAG: zf-HC2 domain-containing protein [Deltaproteobacteria bacterium]|nr:zf-HC2 domain-containing protein [Deltaproteobacteria bacterium]MBW1960742.1 zf-HC2 domain-containing protein [Deltaproteobacteria bacterium]MBW1995710.1 zf-HC2 domain-containing protein [Deltaproteobacteria bacterium]MBW2152614.1 zf-HC2 domain-containing protein [Deltaproteobacteria bacterium]
MNTRHSTHDPQKCRLMFERLSEYIDNELDERICNDIERHIRDCVPCQVCLGTLKRTIELCKHMKNVPVPPRFSANLRELIENLP